MNRARKILKETFGYAQFRHDQEKIIQNILNKEDTLVIMPTGGGKSLCYQIPALIFPGLTVVISPLISLMKDQVEQLSQLGIPAVFLNSSLSSSDYLHNCQLIQNKKVDLLYLAPETLFLEKTLSLLANVDIDCITIDEAHCISEWGHDFRPEYRRITEVLQLFPDAVSLALTATATVHVRKDILSCLGISESSQFISSFDRKNLFLQIIDKYNPSTQILDYLEKFKNQSGIIYCFSRKQVDDLYDFLDNNGFSVRPYHAGLSESDRAKNQEMFIKDDVQIIVATIAFGMGINKPNVRFVVHYDLPKNIESYYQEIGRAGRDGLQADCCLFYSSGDMSKINYFIQQKNEKEKRLASQMLYALVDYVESEDCRRKSLLAYFNAAYNKDCGCCDNCLSEQVEKEDVTIIAQKLLSCIKRTNERFGSGHIVDILRASKSQKIKKFNHDKLSTYGIGQDYTKEHWFDLIRKLLQQGILQKDIEYSALKLTEKSLPLLRSETRVFVSPYKVKQQSVVAESKNLNFNSDLFDLLRTRRKEIADKQSVPPYVIFSDKSLLEMAQYFPQSKTMFSAIYGVAQTKMKKYGDDFIAIISQYCEANKIEEINRNVKVKVKSISKKRAIEVAERFNGGESISVLMKVFKVKEATILNHLYNSTKDGFKLNATIQLSNMDDYKDVKRAFNKHGVEYLSIIFQELKERISYDDLRYYRICFLTEKKPLIMEKLK